MAPLPPKYSVGSLVRFKSNKRNHRWNLAGKVALVVQAEAGGSQNAEGVSRHTKTGQRQAEADGSQCAEGVSRQAKTGQRQAEGKGHEKREVVVFGEPSGRDHHPYWFLYSEQTASQIESTV